MWSLDINELAILVAAHTSGIPPAHICEIEQDDYELARKVLQFIENELSAD